MHPHVTAVIFASVSCANIYRTTARHTNQWMAQCLFRLCDVRWGVVLWKQRSQVIDFQPRYSLCIFHSLNSRENMTKRRIWFLSRVPDEMSVTSTKTFQIGNIIIFHTAANQTYLMQMSKHYTKIILKWVKNELTGELCSPFSQHYYIWITWMPASVLTKGNDLVAIVKSLIQSLFYSRIYIVTCRVHSILWVPPINV